MRVLIIDDTKSMHSFVKDLMKSLDGIDYADVFNGEEALALLKQDAKFDIILLDWEMPKMNGPQTLREIKKMNVSAPVMMMTTKNLPSEIAEMLEAGASEYLMKPFTKDILFEKIEFVLGRSLAHAG